MKLGNYVVMLLVMLVFLEFLGITTGLSTTLGTFGININPTTTELISADIGNSAFWLKVIAVLTAVSAGGAIIIGLFAKSYDTSLVILPLIVFIASLLVGSWWAIILLVQSLEPWITKLISTIFIGLGIGFLWSCVDYFAGR